MRHPTEPNGTVAAGPVTTASSATDCDGRQSRAMLAERHLARTLKWAAAWKELARSLYLRRRDYRAMERECAELTDFSEQVKAENGLLLVQAVRAEQERDQWEALAMEIDEQYQLALKAAYASQALAMIGLEMAMTARILPVEGAT